MSRSLRERMAGLAAAARRSGVRRGMIRPATEDARALLETERVLLTAAKNAAPSFASRIRALAHSARETAYRKVAACPPTSMCSSQPPGSSKCDGPRVTEKIAGTHFATSERPTDTHSGCGPLPQKYPTAVLIVDEYPAVEFPPALYDEAFKAFQVAKTLTNGKGNVTLNFEWREGR